MWTNHVAQTVPGLAYTLSNALSSTLSNTLSNTLFNHQGLLQLATIASGFPG